MVGTVIRSILRWHAERRAIAALAQLSDDRLSDMGLTRGDIVRAVRHGIEA